VVGVVKDSYSLSLDRVEPVFYTPFGGGLTPKVMVRSSGMGAVQAVESIVAQIESRARTEAIPLQDNVERWGSGFRIGAEMASVLGAFALALAAIGMAGVFAYVVEGRTKEIGIRIALGARPWQVIALILGSTSRALAAGLLIGCIAAAALARLMTAFLFGVSPFEVRTYVAAVLILSFAGIAAGFMPARRATRIDPSAALRHD
jgi:putative ABC transport system permease protein